MDTLPSSESDNLTPIIKKYLAIRDVTWGESSQKFLVRYRGKLLMDSVEAFDGLKEALNDQDITHLFREEDDQHVILLVPGKIKPGPSNPWINLGLFVATFFSMLFAGAFYVYDPPSGTTQAELYRALIENLGSGFPFAASLLSILLAHEFGHYLAARYHKTAVTLPYFIPFPILGAFGTLGAAIRLKEPPKNKRVLLDIGIAGPLAGLAVAIPIVLYGLSLSRLDSIPRIFPPGQGTMMEGNSILYLLAKYVTTGQWLPTPITYGDVTPIVYWLKYLFTGLPLPYGAQDVLLHPIAWAGWAGLLVTAINLIPTGQLDGGHTVYALFGKAVMKTRPFILVALIAMGFLYSGWWLWALLIFFLGRNHAEPYDQITKLDPQRKIMAVITLIIFVLVFTPVPLRIMSGSMFVP